MSCRRHIEPVEDGSPPSRGHAAIALRLDRTPAREPTGSGLLALTLAGAILEPCLDRARQLDRHRLAETILRLARGNAAPAFGHRILLDVGALLPLEAARSEERRVGKECVSTCRSRLW